jgi:hypothetical protein
MTEPGEDKDPQRRRDMPLMFLVGAIVVALALGGLIVLIQLSQPRGPEAAKKLPFGAAEQAYAEHIHFGSIQMARAKNMLDQEFTYVAGTMSNEGTRTLKALDVVVEFRDSMNQVVLRDNERLVRSAMAPLGPGQSRDFQITLEHMPADWNQQYPEIHVDGMILQ